MFVYRRGEGAKRRVMHLASFDRMGRQSGVLCGSDYPFNTTINLPLGLKVCRRCRRVEREFAA